MYVLLNNTMIIRIQIGCVRADVISTENLCVRNVYYTFSALIPSVRTQPTCILIIIVLFNRIYVYLIYNSKYIINM